MTTKKLMGGFFILVLAVVLSLSVPVALHARLTSRFLEITDFKVNPSQVQVRKTFAGRESEFLAELKLDKPLQYADFRRIGLVPIANPKTQKEIRNRFAANGVNLSATGVTIFSGELSSSPGGMDLPRSRKRVPM